jgi:hypothetical protein
MALGYCPKCRQNVSNTKADIDVCLFFLLLFTGFGWILYLIIYALQPADRCIICGTHTSPPRPDAFPHAPVMPSNQRVTIRESSYQVMPTPSAPPIQPMVPGPLATTRQTVIQPPQTFGGAPPSPNLPTQMTRPIEDKPEPRFCPYCGAEVGSLMQYCGICGSKL